MGAGIHGGFGRTKGLQNQIKQVKPQKAESAKKRKGVQFNRSCYRSKHKKSRRVFPWKISCKVGA